MIYENKNHRVTVNDKFIYCSSVYMLWKGGAALVEEQYYASNKPIIIKKEKLKKKTKKYTLYRSFDLEFAPEEYLINNGYKLVKK